MDNDDSTWFQDLDRFFNDPPAVIRTFSMENVREPGCIVRPFNMIF